MRVIYQSGTHPNGQPQQQEYSLRFYYERNDENHPVKTVCNISENVAQTGEQPSWKIVARAESKVSNCDQFNKSIGRKIALTRALKGRFTRPARTVFWNKYFGKNVLAGNVVPA